METPMKDLKQPMTKEQQKDHLLAMLAKDPSQFEFVKYVLRTEHNIRIRNPKGNIQKQKLEKILQFSQMIQHTKIEDTWGRNVADEQVAEEPNLSLSWFRDYFYTYHNNSLMLGDCKQDLSMMTKELSKFGPKRHLTFDQNARRIELIDMIERTSLRISMYNKILSSLDQDVHMLEMRLMKVGFSLGRVAELKQYASTTTPYRQPWNMAS